MTDSNDPTIGIIVPVYNEASILKEFHRLLCQVLDSLPNKWQIYYIDDGSTDNTPDILSHLRNDDSRVNILTLSRNFGHQAALTCGLDHAKEDVIISMDGDGQNPPSLIPEMLKLFQAGYDIVVAQRQNSSSGSFFKKITSHLFYNFINGISEIKITPDAADFRLLSRQAVDALNQLPERHRFIRGLVSWVGFKSVVIPFTSDPRLGGESKYTFKKMRRLASDAIFSFSFPPFSVGLLIGSLFLLISLVLAIYSLVCFLNGNDTIFSPDTGLLSFLILLVGGVISILISLVGIYLGYISQEVKGRPVYILKNNLLNKNNISHPEV